MTAIKQFQSTKLAKFQGRRLTYIRYTNISWVVERGFEFPCQMELQVREFYNTFQYKDGVYMSLLITLDEELFLSVGGLTSSRSPLGDCGNESWESFDVVEMYKSCLCGPHYFRNTNYDQPTINNLKLMFAIREEILVNWHAEILKVMFGIISSPSRLHAYGIFILRIIDHVEIDTYEVNFILTNTHEHLVGENLIHKMSIYLYDGQWMYQKDYKTTVDLDLSNEEENANLPE
ncbi:hypothetical protein Lal_00039569 [Lupinus albus]|nr:hypothetical protein Lal_00039569 [Lupinus albus]